MLKRISPSRYENGFALAYLKWRWFTDIHSPEAFQWVCTSTYRVILLPSVDKNGPSTDPWGTPEMTGSDSEVHVAPLMSTCCSLLVRQLQTQFRVWLFSPVCRNLARVHAR